MTGFLMTCKQETTRAKFEDDLAPTADSFMAERLTFLVLPAITSPASRVSFGNPRREPTENSTE